MRDINKEMDLRFIITGCPATGKSTITEAIAHDLGKEIIDTDKLFRAHRADLSSPVTKEFLKWIKDNRIFIKNPDDPCARIITPDDLKDSKKWRNTTFGTLEKGKGFCPIPAQEGFAGEEVFRTYEEFLIKYVLESGMAKDKLLVVSSTAPTRTANIEALEKAGYYFVLLDIHDKDAYDHLFKDWQSYRADGKTRRGAYEMAADKAYNNAIKNAGEATPDTSLEDYAENCAYQALANMYDEVRSRRQPVLERLVTKGKGFSLYPRLEASVDEIASAVKEAATIRHKDVAEQIIRLVNLDTHTNSPRER